MIVQIENYQIRPYPNNLCWEIWKFRDVKKKDGTVERESGSRKGATHRP